AGRIAASRGLATFSNLEMQHSPKIFCIFLQKVLAKNITVYLFVSGNLNFLIDMRYSVYKNWLLTLVIPICFFIVLFLLSKAVEKIPVINNVLFYIGDASLIIMYLHLIIKDNVVIPVWGEGYSIWLYLLVSVIISMTFYFISKRNTLTNWLFNGKVK
ncbi:hypothetical protein ACTM96_13380, partial [Mediterraneibacter faecis]|uniref:hypothetical protein n=1 Tax=Mediterraneibacter faecis TaxID=592978 RepID=UPI003F8A3B05